MILTTPGLRKCRGFARYTGARYGTTPLRSIACPHFAGQRLVICLSDADYPALERKAADMQKSAVKLSGELLEAIISSDIYEAVLDDDK